VIARVRALLRRARPALAEESLEYGGIVVDLAAHKVMRDGAPVHLGPKEYGLLATLMERPGGVFSRERLLDVVWGRDIHVEARSVDVAVRRLRQALNKAGGSDLIRTVRGAGYAIDTGDE
jgi:two-component system phosphate regulon response regulator PhoB